MSTFIDEPQVFVEEVIVGNNGDSAIVRTKNRNGGGYNTVYVTLSQLKTILTEYLELAKYNEDEEILNQTITDITERLDEIEVITVDSELSTESINPVQNNVITNKINELNERIKTYVAGNNIAINGNVISAIDTTYVASDFDIKDLSDVNSLRSTWSNKQDRLTAGNNIEINNNVISAILPEPDTNKYLQQLGDDIESSTLEGGSIVQYVGNTTNSYKNGYIYKMSDGVDRYENVTIPTNETKIIYTNKFDGSTITYYNLQRINLSSQVVVDSNMSGLVRSVSERPSNIDTVEYLINDDDNSYGQTLATTYNENMFSHSAGFYSLFNNYYAPTYGSTTDAAINEFANNLSNRKYQAAFRESRNSEAKVLNITDFIIQVIYKYKYGESGNPIQGYYSARYSKYPGYNGVTEIIGSYLSNIGAQLVNITEIKITDQNVVYAVDENNNEYAVYAGSGSGTRDSLFYKCVDTNGNTKYISNANPYSVYDNDPSLSESNSHYSNHEWVYDKDVDIFLNYNYSFGFTSEPVNIRMKVMSYDEEGYPIAGQGWKRVNVQPNYVLLSLSNVANNLSEVSEGLSVNDLCIITDIDSSKTYYYDVNRTFKGNADNDMIFRYLGNGRFKPIRFGII